MFRLLRGKELQDLSSQHVPARGKKVLERSEWTQERKNIKLDKGAMGDLAALSQDYTPVKDPEKSR